MSPPVPWYRLFFESRERRFRNPIYQVSALFRHAKAPLRAERGHGVERFSFSDRTGVMELSFYGFYVGERLECFPIGGCDIVHKP